MESRISLRSSDLNEFNENSIVQKSQTPTIIPQNSTIRLKGQMKWISHWNLIVFLCHPVYVIHIFIFLIYL